MLIEDRLLEVRRKVGMSQATLAAAMDVSQARVSTIESSEDIQITTLAKYIGGLGGRLEVRAVFDDETVELIA